MRFEIKNASGVTQLAIEGELDAVTVSDLRPDLEKLVKTPPDVGRSRSFSTLRMVDSSGGRRAEGPSTSAFARRAAAWSSWASATSRWRSSGCFWLDRVMLNADSRTPPPAQKSKSRH